MAKILSIDIGTSKLCAGIFDSCNSGFVAMESGVNNSDVTGLPAGYHEQNPEKIVTVIFELIKRLRAGFPQLLKSVEGISVSGQMHGVLLIDKCGKPVTNLITWRDKRASEMKELLSELNTEENFNITGTHLHYGYGGVTLAWLSGHEMIPAGSKALSMADYLVYLLTGNIASEETHAASWGIFDLHKYDWHYPLIEQLGLNSDILPSLNRSAKLLGSIKSEVADNLGLAYDIAVYSPVGDNQSSVIGVAGFEMNKMIFNLGTGGQISIPQKDYKVVTGFETRPMPGSGSILVGASLCGGWSYAYLCDFVKNIVQQFAGIEMDYAEVYKRLDTLAAEADAECGGLVVDTRFAGTRDDHALYGSISNINTDNFSISNLARGFMVGMVKELAELADRVDTSGIEKVYACGNGVKKNPLMHGIIADVLGKPVDLSVIDEEAAVGAALAVMRVMPIDRGDDE